MADLKGNKKRLMTINLSLFAPSDPNTNTSSPTISSPTISKSPKSFKPNGVVGLGIVVAMDKLDHPKSTPIPIFSASSAAKMGGGGKFAGPISEEEEMELSEDYTCVTSHIGNNLIKKREYFDGVLANESESTVSDWVVAEEEEKAPAVVFRTADFLNSCYLCKKQLHGLDIFMYRGEKAFCSSECRGKQISMDECKEKYTSGAILKPRDYSSVSPCSSPMQFFAGVAAA